MPAAFYQLTRTSRTFFTHALLINILKCEFRNIPPFLGGRKGKGKHGFV